MAAGSPDALSRKQVAWDSKPFCRWDGGFGHGACTDLSEHALYKQCWNLSQSIFLSPASKCRENTALRMETMHFLRTPYKHVNIQHMSLKHDPHTGYAEPYSLCKIITNSLRGQ